MVNADLSNTDLRSANLDKAHRGIVKLSCLAPLCHLQIIVRSADCRCRESGLVGAVAGIGAWQRAQRHHPRHEAEISVRFAG